METIVHGPRATNIRIPDDFEARMTSTLVNGHGFPKGAEVLVCSLSTRPFLGAEEVSTKVEINGHERCVTYTHAG